jgi:hypothetical protein
LRKCTEKTTMSHTQIVYKYPSIFWQLYSFN